MSGHFAAALTRLESALIAMSPRLPPEAPTTRMVREISAAEAAPREPQPNVLEAVRRRLRQALSEGRTPEARDLKQAPWILWQGDPPAISFAGLLDMVVGQATQSPRAVRYLIEAWLRDFSPQAPAIERTGLAIQRLLADSADSRLDLWRTAQSRFRLFDAEHGPATLARAVLAGNRPVPEVLQETGFSDEARAVSSYLRAVQAAVLAQIPSGLGGPRPRDFIARACQFLSNGSRLRFDDTRSAVARSMCQPWLAGGRQPEPDIQQVVKEFLVDRIGNPQLRPGRWAGAEKESALIRRWLARASLQVFFGLIADYALDSQWAYREAFWSACLEKGAIDDAWLALGANVHASARAQEGLGGAFGHLVGAGASGDQSVLLLRIGPLVVAEWSHNGSLRAWPAEQAPKLGLASYARSDLMRACLSFPPDPARPGNPDRGTSGLRHMGAATGVWQRRAALLLARYANVTLHPMDWRVR